MSRKTRTISVGEYVRQARERVKQEQAVFKKILPGINKVKELEKVKVPSLKGAVLKSALLAGLPIAAFFAARSLRRRLRKSSRSSKRARTRRVSSR